MVRESIITLEESSIFESIQNLWLDTTTHFNHPAPDWMREVMTFRDIDMWARQNSQNPYIEVCTKLTDYVTKTCRNSIFEMDWSLSENARGAAVLFRNGPLPTPSKNVNSEWIVHTRRNHEGALNEHSVFTAYFK